MSPAPASRLAWVMARYLFVEEATPDNSTVVPRGYVLSYAIAFARSRGAGVPPAFLTDTIAELNSGFLGPGLSHRDFVFQPRVEPGAPTDTPPLRGRSVDLQAALHLRLAVAAATHAELIHGLEDVYATGRLEDEGPTGGYRVRKVEQLTAKLHAITDDMRRRGVAKATLLLPAGDLAWAKTAFAAGSWEYDEQARTLRYAAAPEGHVVRLVPATTLAEAEHAVWGKRRALIEDALREASTLVGSKQRYPAWRPWLLGMVIGAGIAVLGYWLVLRKWVILVSEELPTELVGRLSCFRVDVSPRARDTPMTVLHPGQRVVFLSGVPREWTADPLAPLGRLLEEGAVTVNVDRTPYAENRRRLGRAVHALSTHFPAELLRKFEQTVPEQVPESGKIVADCHPSTPSAVEFAACIAVYKQALAIFGPKEPDDPKDYLTIAFTGFSGFRWSPVVTHPDRWPCPNSAEYRFGELLLKVTRPGWPTLCRPFNELGDSFRDEATDAELSLVINDDVVEDNVKDPWSVLGPGVAPADSVLSTVHYCIAG